MVLLLAFAFIVCCVFELQFGSYARRGAKDRATGYLAFGLTFSVQSLCVMVCCMLHGRHLMVWGVFAPKFIFNSVALVLTDVLLLFTYVI